MREWQKVGNPGRRPCSPSGEGASSDSSMCEEELEAEGERELVLVPRREVRVELLYYRTVYN